MVSSWVLAYDPEDAKGPRGQIQENLKGAFFCSLLVTEQTARLFPSVSGINLSWQPDTNSVCLRNAVGSYKIAFVNASKASNGPNDEIS